jgi:imidazole glycerol-phosphate synthase subunit HisF
MLRTRVIPALLLRDECLVKTRQFRKFDYVGDPCNTVRIFNELEVDELLFLDILATPRSRGPDLRLLSSIAEECFMPLGYGGGIRTLDDAKAILDLGFEKIAINTGAVECPSLLGDVARHAGSQALIAAIDVKSSVLGRKTVRVRSGRRNTSWDPVGWAREVEDRGAGEILLTSIDREGSWDGFDLDLVQKVSDSVSIPVIAHGGAGQLSHIEAVIRQGRASAVALGSMVVYQKKGMGVLVSFPERAELERRLA